MSLSQVEIICAACGKESLLKRMPKYDGFKKVGESLTCSDCGHEYASEDDIPFKQKGAPKVFDAGDAPRTVKVFQEKEADRLCRQCKHYVVNPFIQRCGRHGKQVEATDTCRDFEKKVLSQLAPIK